MENVLLMTRLKNLVKKENDIEYQYHLRNIVINGVKKGCSGFIVNPHNHLCIYVNTEHSCYAPLSNKFMYRYAKDTNDFSGDANLWANSESELAKGIVKLLESNWKGGAE